ncbi:MAG TPA: sulfate ABC transporter substrate-binding protein [Actinomycetota bacterium]|nr:sulfate ABC transporter substrate-binding protein [Actinomycetota bacterium]
MRSRLAFRLSIVLAVFGLLVAACSSDGSSNTTGSRGSSASNASDCTPAETPVLTLAAYSNPYVAYGKITTNFANDWKGSHDDQSMIWQLSFGGSTTQATNIVNGFEADIYASSLAPDVQLVEDAGLITHDWQSDTDGSIVQAGSVVFAVRPGNPEAIENWDDLTKPGLQILTPDPAQSGGAKWNIVAAYGAAMRGEVPGYEANNPADAERLLEGIFANVTVLDKSANDSLKNFEAGNGDVAITYDYQLATSIASGIEEELVEPPSTVAIRTPAVVVDQYAEGHCVQEIADAFVEYLHTPDAQEVFYSSAYTRPVDPAKTADATDNLPAVDDLFTTDDIGGWDELTNDTVFGPNGAFTQAFAAVQG